MDKCKDNHIPTDVVKNSLSPPSQWKFLTNKMLEDIGDTWKFA